MMKEEREVGEPLSEKCKRILEDELVKDDCYYPSRRSQHVMCKAWQLMEEKKMPFKDAMKEAWRWFKDECAKISAVTEE